MSTFFLQAEDGQTPVSEDELRELKISIVTRAQLNEHELHGITQARRWAMGRRTLASEYLTDHFARELHRRMFTEVWRWAGRYRARPINLEFSWAPHRITEGVRVLLDDTSYQIANGSYPLHEIAVRTHHRLVVIHPWVNGNGRHARLLADMIVAANGGEALTWGARLDLVRAGEARRNYLAAMREADAGHFAPLIDFAHH